MFPRRERHSSNCLSISNVIWLGRDVTTQISDDDVTFVAARRDVSLRSIQCDASDGTGVRILKQVR